MPILYPILFRLVNQPRLWLGESEVLTRRAGYGILSTHEVLRGISLGHFRKYDAGTIREKVSAFTRFA